jgi:cysteine desulfurase/selenocysteine lyase
MSLPTQHIDIKRKDQLDLQQIRADFPILSRKIKGQPLVYLDNGASSQKPQQVLDAINAYYSQTHSNVHRGVHTLSQEATSAYENARITCKAFLNAPSSDEVIFTKGTTDSINLVAFGFGMRFLNTGDEVLISGMEHHSNIVPWQLICEIKGAMLKVIPVEDDGTILLDKVKSLINERTKIIAITHISNTLGTINPVEEIIQIAHGNDIPVLIDGAQAAPHFKIDVQSLDADFYAASGHKMYGPTGIGLLFGKKKWLDQMTPYQGGGDMIDRVTFEKTTFAEIPFKFEAGTPNIAGAIGLEAAIHYIQSVGYDAIHAQEAMLLDYTTERLSEIDNIRIIGTSTKKASVISFILEGSHPYDVGTILDQFGIAVRTGHHCTQPLMDQYQIPGTIRASFAFYNTIEEVDILINGIKKAASMLI